ncbi:MAG: hypothetical protein U0270_20110 [Labilithrix sp.]
MPNTILPGTIANAEVDPAGTQRYVPAVRVERDIDRPQPSAFPSARRFETIYPRSRASEEATAAALAAARDHDRSSSSGLLDVLLGRSLDD